MSDGPLTYSAYLQLEKLLQAQAPKTDEHDELQFIVVHQVFELWFKLALHELGAVFTGVDADDLPAATRALRRINTIVRVFPHYVEILETMSPQDFHKFRTALEGASGLQSEQFRELELLSGLAEEASYLEFLKGSPHWTPTLERRLGGDNLRAALRRLLERRGVTLEAVYGDTAAHADLHTLLETCMDYDESLLAWRFSHVQLAERMIGSGALGTGGMGARYLRGTLRYRMFPDLWQLRDKLTLTGGGALLPSKSTEKNG